MDQGQGKFFVKFNRGLEMGDSLDRKMYPFAPLLKVLKKTFPHMSEQFSGKRDYEGSDYVIKDILGVHARTFDRWVSRGNIREDFADMLACRLGLHPYLIWGDLWFNYDGCEMGESIDG
jgi:hypothetical protein